MTAHGPEVLDTDPSSRSRLVDRSCPGGAPPSCRGSRAAEWSFHRAGARTIAAGDHHAPFHADDPTARASSNDRLVVSPVATGDLTWHEVVAARADADLEAGCADRYLRDPSPTARTCWATSWFSRT